MNGFLFVDKPIGPSSFDIIRKVRRVLAVKKIGHSGTLDPAASGLLILAVGKTTRLLPYLPAEPKTYHFTIQFGSVTDTLDSAGTICEQGKPFPKKATLAESLKLFNGKTLQKPPLYSAIKVKGTRAYKLARQNQNVTLAMREITIHSLQLVTYEEKTGRAQCITECSKGTYIRSLARDIAENAGTIGYASSIRRTAIYNFQVNDALTLDELDTNASASLRPVNEIFAQYPSYCASTTEINNIAHGHDIVTDTSADKDLLFIYNPMQELIAVAKNVSTNKFHPVKVLI